MDDDEKDGAKRAETAHQSKKATQDVLKRVARPAWRSPLFWWLAEHHDALRQNEAGDWARGALARALPGIRGVGDNAGGWSTGEAGNRQNNLATGPQGIGACRGAPRERTRGAREARGDESAARHALAIPQGRVRTAARARSVAQRRSFQRRQFSKRSEAFSSRPRMASL